MFRPRAFIAGTCFILLAGCPSAQPPDPLSPAEVARLETSVAGQIGGYDSRPEYLFDGIRDVAVVDGAILVLDGGSGEVRAFTPSGTLEWVIGGKGEGPGEFVSVRRLSPLPDGRLMVWDGRLQRATVFTRDHEVAQTASPQYGPMALFFSGFVGAFTDGSWVQRIEVNPLELQGEAEGPRRDSVVFELVSDTGDRLHPLATHQGPVRILRRYTESSWEREKPIFGRELLSTVRGDTLLIVHTDSLVVERIARNGHHLSPLRLARPSRPASENLVNARRAQLVSEAEQARERSGGAALGMGASLQGRVDALRSMPSEPSLPAVADILVGSDGVVWMRDFRPPGSDELELWFRFDEDFNPSGWVELSGGQQMIAAGDGLLVTVSKDELNVETVTVHRVR